LQRRKLELLGHLAVLLVVFGTLLALGFGLWLVHLDHWGYGRPADAALGLLLTTIALGGIGGQRPSRRENSTRGRTRTCYT
jgi:hypothetical protein